MMQSDFNNNLLMLIYINLFSSTCASRKQKHRKTYIRSKQKKKKIETNSGIVYQIKICFIWYLYRVCKQ